MQKQDLIELADCHYHDGLVAEAYESPDDPVNDLTARVIVDAVDAACQLPVGEDRHRSAADELRRVATDLMAVAAGLEAGQDQPAESASTE